MTAIRWRWVNYYGDEVQPPLVAPGEHSVEVIAIDQNEHELVFTVRHQVPDRPAPNPTLTALVGVRSRLERALAHGPGAFASTQIWHHAYTRDIQVLVACLDELVFQATRPRPPVFLDWIADRLTNRHGEPENVDFVQALRRMAERMREMVDAWGSPDGSIQL